MYTVLRIQYIVSAMLHARKRMFTATELLTTGIVCTANEHLVLTEDEFSAVSRKDNAVNSVTLQL